MSDNIEFKNGVILSCIGGLYSVETDDGKIYKCKAKGLFREKHIKPITGDNCTLRINNSINDDIYIVSIDKRKSFLNRPNVANVDTLFLTFAPKLPTPDLENIDKQIYACTCARINPVLVITKNDLDKDFASYIKKIYSRDFKVFVTSSYDNYGIDELKSYISNNCHICAFSGSSGTGKSSIIKAMFPFLELESGELSKKIQRGKNTTRQTTLYKIDNKFYICDTPGFSSLYVEYDEKTDLDNIYASFPEIFRLKDKCLWADCTHTKEKGCAIKEGIKNGDISEMRYNHFINILTNKTSS